MAQDFNWFDADAESVVIAEQPMTAVYSNSHGQIVLRQKADGCYQDEDTLAYFNPQGALAAAWALIEQAHLIGLPEPSLSLMVESPHWPPKRRGSANPPQTAPAPDGGTSEPGPLLKVMQAGAE
jgi:hypothetical protein